MATDTTPATGTGRTGITRPVLLAGIALGTCLTILTMWNGARLRVPDLPSIISAALGALIVWVLFMAVAAVLSELTVRHHRAALAHGWRHGKRGGAAAVRHGRGERPGARLSGRVRGVRGSSRRCGPGGPHAAAAAGAEDLPGAMAQPWLRLGDPRRRHARRNAGRSGLRMGTAPPTRGDPRTARPAGQRMTRRRRTAGRST